MKTPIWSSLTVSILCLAGCSSPNPSLAKISQKDAEGIALTKVQGGTVQSAELERENGRLVWSFDISISDSEDLREVLIDAETGKVVALETETPAQQAAEAAQDARKRQR